MHLRQKDIGLAFAALILTIPLVSGCSASRAATPAYEFHRPTFQVTPQILECQKETPATEDGKAAEAVTEQCVVLLVSDFVMILAELESTCIATGNSEKTCALISQQKDGK